MDGAGALYAGGDFTTAGGVCTNDIAKWDGSVVTLGQRDEWPARAGGEGAGDLYAGGYFTTAGGVTVNRIAKWDGSAWSALGWG